MTFKEFLDDTKKFVWYCATQPWRSTVQTFKELLNLGGEGVRAFRSFRIWSVSFFCISILLVVLGEREKALISFATSLLFLLLYEWNSKRYRHEWKVHKVEKIKEYLETKNKPV